MKKTSNLYYEKNENLRDIKVKNSDAKKKNEVDIIHVQNKPYKIDSSKNLDCSRNIQYLDNLIEKNKILMNKINNKIEEKPKIEDKNKDNIIEENISNTTENFVDLPNKIMPNINAKSIINNKKLINFSKIILHKISENF